MMENIITYLIIGLIVIAINYGYRYIESDYWRKAQEPSVLDLLLSIILWPVATIILTIDIIILVREQFKKKV